MGKGEMAWISIHDTIDGPKLRDLYKTLGISKFEATGMLVFLWQWGLQNADESGCLISIDREDVERFMHGASAGCSADEGAIFEALLKTGWIDEEDGKLYLHDWSLWQKEWYKYKTKLKKDAERKRRIARSISSEKKNKPVEKKPEIPTEVPSETPAETPVEKRKRQKIGYTDEFTRFWEVYPRTDRKSEAFECFLARIKNGVAPEDMISAAEAYAAKCKRDRTQPKYIMQAKTFLGVHLNFMDYVKQKPVQEKIEGNPFSNYTEG